MKFGYTLIAEFKKRLKITLKITKNYGQRARISNEQSTRIRLLRSRAPLESRVRIKDDYAFVSQLVQFKHDARPRSEFSRVKTTRYLAPITDFIAALLYRTSLELVRILCFNKNTVFLRICIFGTCDANQGHKKPRNSCILRIITNIARAKIMPITLWHKTHELQGFYD